MNLRDKRYLNQMAEVLEDLARNIELGEHRTVKGLTVNESMRHMAAQMKTYGRA